MAICEDVAGYAGIDADLINGIALHKHRFVKREAIAEALQPIADSKSSSVRLYVH
jgi:hypothetical protein